MLIPNNIIAEKLKNVFFILGRGKTTVANKLNSKYGCYVYSNDDARDRMMELASPELQPYMCRDYVSEYGVKSFWALPKEVIADREVHFLEEVTPMIIAELLTLAEQHEIIICEDDINSGMIAQISENIVYLQNCGTKFDWFDRPDHLESIEAIRKNNELTEAEKREIIDNAYRSIETCETELPDWVIENKINVIRWDDSVSPDETADDTARCFGLL